MNKVALEIQINIASLLERKEQWECSKVSKLWRKIFRPLTFQDVTFSGNGLQEHDYIVQDPSLRRLTTSFRFKHFYGGFFRTNELEELADASPHVNAIAVEFEDERMEYSEIIAVMDECWFDSLVKIDMRDKLLRKVLESQLSDQLEEVKGNLISLFYKNTDSMIPLPRLKKLGLTVGKIDEECEEYHESSHLYISNIITVDYLDKMRIAYPMLEDLSLEYINFETVGYDEYTPFPFVKSLQLSECTENDEDVLSEWSEMFTGLKRFSISDHAYHDDLWEAKDPFSDFFTQNSTLTDVCMDYLGGVMTGKDDYPAFQELTALTKLELFRYRESSTYLKRELLDFDMLISSMPNLTWLKLVGEFHLSTGEHFDNYLSGTVGYCDNTNSSNINKDSKTTVTSTINKKIKPLADDNGEELWKFETHIKTVRKKMPKPKNNKPVSIYAWNETYSSIIESPKESITSYPLKSLILDGVTLRNPTYKWIAQHLPLLKRFHVNKSEPYPFFEIILGKRIDSFVISLNERYRRYGNPIVHLIDYHSGNKTTLGGNSFKKLHPVEDIGLSTYAINITYQAIPCYLKVCGKDVAKALHNVKD